jgi:hypothetical protein
MVAVTQEVYASDNIFIEEKDPDSIISGSAKTLQQKSHPDSELVDHKQSREYIEFNLEFQYTSDEEHPLRVLIDIPVSQTSPIYNNEEKKRTDTSQSNK